MRAAIAFHLEGLAESGEPIPGTLLPPRLHRTRRGSSVSLAQSGGRTQLELHDGVRLRREVGGFPAGTEGTIVQVFPEQHAYGVGLFEAPGETVGLIDVAVDDLEAARKPID